MIPWLFDRVISASMPCCLHSTSTGWALGRHAATGFSPFHVNFRIDPAVLRGPLKVGTYSTRSQSFGPAQGCHSLERSYAGCNRLKHGRVGKNRNRSATNFASMVGLAPEAGGAKIWLLEQDGPVTNAETPAGTVHPVSLRWPQSSSGGLDAMWRSPPCRGHPLSNWITSRDRTGHQIVRHCTCLVYNCQDCHQRICHLIRVRKQCKASPYRY